MSEPPGYAYFRPKHGRWTGAYVLTSESLRALFSGSMGFFDKLTFALLGLVCRVLGPLRIETSVDASKLEDARVYHTTRVSKWGLPLMWSEEWFTFDAEGQTFAVSGGVRSLPFGWVVHPYRESHGTIDDKGQCASYDFRWAGSRVRQRSNPRPDGLQLVQELDGCRATFVLRKLT